MQETELKYRPKSSADSKWVTEIVQKEWCSTKIISKDKIFEASELPGFIAEQEGLPVGLILFADEGKEREIVVLFTSIEKRGIGTKLMEMVHLSAKEAGVKRLWLQTTNDNTDALRFYQKRSYTISAVRPNAIEAQRRVKPIPLLGHYNIPIRDEIELELLL